MDIFKLTSWILLAATLLISVMALHAAGADDDPQSQAGEALRRELERACEMLLSKPEAAWQEDSSTTALDLLANHALESSSLLDALLPDAVTKERRDRVAALQTRIAFEPGVRALREILTVKAANPRYAKVILALRHMEEAMSWVANTRYYAIFYHDSAGEVIDDAIFLIRKFDATAFSPYSALNTNEAGGLLELAMREGIVFNDADSLQKYLTRGTGEFFAGGFVRRWDDGKSYVIVQYNSGLPGGHVLQTKMTDTGAIASYASLGHIEFDESIEDFMKHAVTTEDANDGQQ